MEEMEFAEVIKSLKSTASLFEQSDKSARKSVIRRAEESTRLMKYLTSIIKVFSHGSVESFGTFLTRRAEYFVLTCKLYFRH